MNEFSISSNLPPAKQSLPETAQEESSLFETVVETALNVGAAVADEGMAATKMLSKTVTKLDAKACKQFLKASKFTRAAIKNSNWKLASFGLLCMAGHAANASIKLVFPKEVLLMSKFS